MIDHLPGGFFLFFESHGASVFEIKEPVKCIITIGCTLCMNFFLGPEHSRAHLTTICMRKFKLFITQQNRETVKGQIQLTQ